MSRHDVLLAKPELIESPALAGILAAFDKMPFQDAARLARRCWGVAGRDLEEQRARELAAKLKEGGLDAILAPAGSLKPLPAPEEARRLDPADPSLSTARLVAAAAFQSVSSSIVQAQEGPSTGQQLASMGIMMATGLPIRLGPKAEKVARKVQQTELALYLDIVWTDPLRRRRFESARIDYACLGEKMGPQSLENFKTLVKEAAAAAPAAVRGHGTRILLSNRPLREMKFESLDDLDREEQWLLALQSHY